MPSSLEILQNDIVGCHRCSRLIEHCGNVARVKRRAFRDWDYWGKPVPSFGDPNAQVLIIGLAPAAHGANRTGRMFTGDRSGDLLYKVLHAAGFASQPESRSSADGMQLHNVYISAVVRCAPPDNKPIPAEIAACQSFLENEIDLLPRIKVVVALGRLAFDAYLSILQKRGVILRRSSFVFGHNARHRTASDQPLLISSYHPSQQNTLTGRLTESMFEEVFRSACAELNATS